MARRHLCGAILALALAFGLPAQALAAGITNGGFEDGDFPQGVAFQTLWSGTPGAASMTGWTVTAGSVDWINGYWNAQDGARSLDMNGTPNDAVPLAAGAITQSLVTQGNATYVVQFFLAGNPDCGPGDKSLTVSATGAAAQSYTFNNTAATTHDVMGWTAEAYSFVATGSSTELIFAADPSNTSFCGPALDGVSVTMTLATGADCKDGGWRTMSDDLGQPFKNQGACVSFFATRGDTPIGSGE